MAQYDVVIPVRNGAAYISQCLDSVLAQTVPAARIIVSDDGSSDATERIVAAYAARDPRVEFHKSAAGGVSSARNRGIRLSTAPFIAFLDADDIWMHDKAALQLAVFEAGGAQLGAVHCAYEHMNEDGTPRPQDIPVPPKKQGKIFEDLLFNQYVLSGSAAAAMVRRAVLDEVGLFDERLFLGEDWDLWIRIAEKYDWDYAPETLVKIRIHEASAQRRPDPDKDRKYFFQHLIIYNRYYGKLVYPPEIAQRLREDAVRIVVKRYFNPFVALGLYRTLKGSDLLLAHDLFPDFATFARKLLPMAIVLVVTKLKALARRALNR